MTMTPEQRKADLVDRLASEAQKRVGDDQAESAEHSSAATSRSSLPTTSSTPPSRRSSAARFRSGSSASSATPATPKVRLFNPTVEANGWGLEHTVIEIVNDDMPFLVDSVSAEVNRLGRNIHLLLHPVVRVRRDAGGEARRADRDAGSADRRHRRVVHARRDRSGDRRRRSSRRCAPRSSASCTRCAPP